MADKYPLPDGFFLEDLSADEHDVLRAFVAEVNRRAENKMEKTGKLEGSHYAAMRELLKELCG